jgi:NTP pyrophosphatase (non-canonical NTP hydrolase)
MTIFQEAWRAISSAVHSNARAKGFWDHHDESVKVLRDAGRDDLAVATGLAYCSQKLKLMGDELAEASEGLRDMDPESEKIKGFTQQEEELADVVIRIMDYGAHEGLDIARAIEAKMARNKSRPRLHGREF